MTIYGLNIQPQNGVIIGLTKLRTKILCTHMKERKRYKNMTEHELAVERCNTTIKNMQNAGYFINAVSWFDDTHYHINFSTLEDIKKREENLKNLIGQFKEKFKDKKPVLTPLEDNILAMFTPQ